MEEEEKQQNIIKQYKEDINAGLKQNFGTIIPAGQVNINPNNLQVIGGDGGAEEHEPPAIVIEKKDGQISKIIVKCPCGRTSEVICEYTEKSTSQEEE